MPSSLQVKKKEQHHPTVKPSNQLRCGGTLERHKFGGQPQPEDRPDLGELEGVSPGPGASAVPMFSRAGSAESEAKHQPLDQEVLAIDGTPIPTTTSTGIGALKERLKDVLSDPGPPPPPAAAPSPTKPPVGVQTGSSGRPLPTLEDAFRVLNLAHKTRGAVSSQSPPGGHEALDGFDDDGLGTLGKLQSDSPCPITNVHDVPSGHLAPSKLESNPTMVPSASTTKMLESKMQLLDLESLKVHTAQDRALRIIDALGTQQLERGGTSSGVAMSARVPGAAASPSSALSKARAEVAALERRAQGEVFSRDPLTNLREALKHIIANATVYGPVHDLVLKEVNYVVSMWCGDTGNLAAQAAAVNNGKELPSGPGAWRPHTYVEEEAKKRKQLKSLGAEPLHVKENIFDRLLVQNEKLHVAQLQATHGNTKNQGEESDHDIHLQPLPPIAPHQARSVSPMLANDIASKPKVGPPSPAQDAISGRIPFDKSTPEGEALALQATALYEARETAMESLAAGMRSPGQTNLSPGLPFTRNVPPASNNNLGLIHGDTTQDSEQVRVAVAREVAMLRKRLHQQENRLEHMKGQLEDAEVQLLDKDDTIKNLEHCLKQAEISEAGFKKQSARQGDRIAMLRKELLDFQNNVIQDHRKREMKEGNAERRLQESKEEISQLYRHLHAAEHQSIILEREIGNAHLDREEFENKYFKALRESEDVQVQLGKKEKEMQLLGEECDSHIENIDHMRGQMKELQLIAGHSTIADRLMVEHPVWSLVFHNMVQNARWVPTQSHFLHMRGVITPGANGLLISDGILPALTFNLTHCTDVAKIQESILAECRMDSTDASSNPCAMYRNCKGVGLGKAPSHDNLVMSMRKANPGATISQVDAAEEDLSPSVPEFVLKRHILFGLSSDPLVDDEKGSDDKSSDAEGSRSVTTPDQPAVVAVSSRKPSVVEVTLENSSGPKKSVTHLPGGGGAVLGLHTALSGLIARYTGQWPPLPEDLVGEDASQPHQMRFREGLWPLEPYLDISSLFNVKPVAPSRQLQLAQIAEQLLPKGKRAAAGQATTTGSAAKTLSVKNPKLTRGDLSALLSLFWHSRYEDYCAFAQEQCAWLQEWDRRRLAAERKLEENAAKEEVVVTPSKKRKKKGEGEPIETKTEANVEPEEPPLSALRRFPTFLEGLIDFLNLHHGPPVKTKEDEPTEQPAKGGKKAEVARAAAAKAALPEIVSSHPLGQVHVGLLSTAALEALVALHHTALELREVDIEMHLFYLLSHQLIPEQLVFDLLHNLGTFYTSCEVSYLESTMEEETVQPMSSARAPTASEDNLAALELSGGGSQPLPTSSAPKMTTIDAATLQKKQQKTAFSFSEAFFTGTGGTSKQGGPSHTTVGGLRPNQDPANTRKRSMLGFGPAVPHARRSIMLETSTLLGKSGLTLAKIAGGVSSPPGSPAHSRVTSPTVLTPTNKSKSKKANEQEPLLYSKSVSTTGFMRLTQFCDVVESAMYRVYCTPPGLIPGDKVTLPGGESSPSKADSKAGSKRLSLSQGPGGDCFSNVQPLKTGKPAAALVKDPTVVKHTTKDSKATMSHLDLLRFKFALSLDQPSNVVRYPNLFQVDMAGRPTFFVTEFWTVYVERFLDYQEAIVQAAVGASVESSIIIPAPLGEDGLPPAPTSETKDVPRSTPSSESDSSSSNVSQTKPSVPPGMMAGKAVVLVDMKKFRHAWLLMDPGRSSDMGAILRLLTKVEPQADLVSSPPAAKAEGPRSPSLPEPPSPSDTPPGEPGTAPPRVPSRGDQGLQRPTTVGRSTVADPDHEARDIDHWHFDQWRDLLVHNNRLLLREGCLGDEGNQKTADGTTLGDYMLGIAREKSKLVNSSDLPRGIASTLPTTAGGVKAADVLDPWYHSWLNENFTIPDFFPRDLLLQRIRLLYLHRASSVEDSGNVGGGPRNAAGGSTPASPVPRGAHLKQLKEQHQADLKKFTARMIERAKNVDQRSKLGHALENPYCQILAWAEEKPEERGEHVAGIVQSLISTKEAHNKKFQKQFITQQQGGQPNQTKQKKGRSNVGSINPGSPKTPHGNLNSNFAASMFVGEDQSTAPFDAGKSTHIFKDPSGALPTADQIQSWQHVVRTVNVPLAMNAQSQLKRRLGLSSKVFSHADTCFAELGQYSEARTKLVALTSAPSSVGTTGIIVPGEPTTENGLFGTKESPTRTVAGHTATYSPPQVALEGATMEKIFGSVHDQLFVPVKSSDVQEVANGKKSRRGSAVVTVSSGEAVEGGNPPLGSAFGEQSVPPPAQEFQIPALSVNGESYEETSTLLGVRKRALSALYDLSHSGIVGE